MSPDELFPETAPPEPCPHGRLPGELCGWCNSDQAGTAPPSGPPRETCRHRRPADSCRVCGSVGAPAPAEPAARRSDPHTSREAAASVGNLRELQVAILRALAEQRRALADEQLAALIDQPASPSGLRTRRSELAAAGLVEAGGYGKTKAGRRCQLWRITPAGSAALRAQSAR